MDGNIEHDMDYELLGRYFAGECTPDEASSAQAWIEASPENQRTYAALKTIWEESPRTKPALDVNVEAAWKKVRTRTQPQALPLTPPSPTRSPRPWVRIAAMLVIGLGIASFFLWRKLNPSEPGAATMLAWQTDQEKHSDTLPDGSIVTLNAHSRLEYPSSFAGSPKRLVRLQGEAYFDVHSDASQPFVVDAGETEVQVVGTAFNVNTDGQAAQVTVTEGKVRFASKKQRQEVLLVAGNSARYRESKIVQDSTADDNALYWLSGRLVYRNEPLARVVEEIAARWKQDVRLANPEIGNCRLSATFEQPSLESILKMIAETFSLELTQDEHGYQLQGKGCL